MNDAVLAGLDARQQADAELEGMVLHLVAREHDVEVPGPHHADLARAELLGERGTGLGARAVGDVLGRDHVARPLVDLP